jgi:hypothetical protein
MPDNTGTGSVEGRQNEFDGLEFAILDQHFQAGEMV